MGREGLRYETLAISRSLELARAAFAAAIAEKPAGRFTIRNRTRVGEAALPVRLLIFLFVVLLAGVARERAQQPAG